MENNLPRIAVHLLPPSLQWSYRKIAVLSITGLPTNKKAFQWLGMGCQESRQCCASCRWSAQDDDNMAWISLPILKNRSTSFILTHTAVLVFRPVSFCSTKAPLPRTMLWRCAPQRTGCQKRSGSSAPICPSPRQRGASQNANQSCGVRPDPAWGSSC